MKTKTLLIAAATLAVGAITSQAQVYSQNIVGYINQTIAANHYQIIGSQLINGSDAVQTNGDIGATLISGPISSSASDATTSTNTQLAVWGGISYITYYFYTGSDADIAFAPATGHATGWYSRAGVRATFKLNSSHSAFMHNVSAIPLTNTVVGTVFQGTNVYVTQIKNGYNLLCLTPAVAGNSTNLVVDGSGNQAPFGLPMSLTSSTTAPPTQASNDSIAVWGGISFITYYFYKGADADVAFAPATGHATGFYSKAGVAMSAGVYPPVNQGFFIYHNGSTINWTNSF